MEIRHLGVTTLHLLHISVTHKLFQLVVRPAYLTTLALLVIMFSHNLCILCKFLICLTYVHVFFICKGNKATAPETDVGLKMRDVGLVAFNAALHAPCFILNVER
jgi:hypothetical protein